MFRVFQCAVSSFCLLSIIALDYDPPKGLQYWCKLNKEVIFLMKTDELDDLIERVSDLVEALDKRGCVLMIGKKPRSHSWVKMYNPAVKMIDPMTRFGATRVKEFRERDGLSICDLAKEMEIDSTLVRRIENDEQTHTYKSLKRFADYFGCSVEDLLK